MTYDDAHTKHLANAVAAFADPAAATHVRVPCGWCSSTGRVEHWTGWAHAGDRSCARCAGRGFVLVEGGSCHD